MEFECITLFEISTVELITMQNFMQLKRSLTLELKMSHMNIFSMENLSYCSKSAP